MSDSRRVPFPAAAAGAFEKWCQDGSYAADYEAPHAEAFVAGYEIARRTIAPRIFASIFVMGVVSGFALGVIFQAVAG